MTEQEAEDRLEAFYAKVIDIIKDAARKANPTFVDGDLAAAVEAIRDAPKQLEIRPLGNRVLIKPAPKPTVSASGLVIVDQERWQPDTVGTVVALGDGIEALKRAVQRFGDRVLDAIGDERRRSGPDFDDQNLYKTVMEMIVDYRPEHVCAVGDEVTFGVTAGTELDLGGETYLLVDEADLETILVPVERACQN